MTATPTSVTAPEQPPVDRALSFASTVDRSLVHRDSLGEVFVTDLRSDGESGYRAAAQLPRSHAYYGDHLLRPRAHDPILLLEAARQAALAGAHAFYGIPAEDKFILTFLRIHLLRPLLLTVRDAPLALTMDVSITDRKIREGRTVGLDHTIGLSVGGTTIGWAGVGLRFRDAAGYRALRLTGRDGVEPLSSAALPPGTGPVGAPATPYLVGRGDPDNVLLLDPEPRDGAVHAVLRVPAGHPSLFDHPQDHLPGMVLAEAARQLALFAALDSSGTSSAKNVLTELNVTFTRFGELEPATYLSAVCGVPRPTPGEEHVPIYTQAGLLELESEDSSDIVSQLSVEVDAQQNKESIARFSLTLARIRG